MTPLIILIAMSPATYPVGTYPDPVLTPGAADPAVTQENVQDTICMPGYTVTVRNVSAATKRRVVERYLEAHPDWPKCKPVGDVDCEIDHLVSLELGGLNDESNLFPQFYCPLPRQPGCFGAREKDVVETWLHRQICSGAWPLDMAQRHIRNDWVAEYKALHPEERDKTKCFTNLCGDPMYGEQGCYCHNAGDHTRCWSREPDCEVDRSCCLATNSCDGMPHKGERCADKTAAERKP